jgi:carbamoyltransferase
VSPHHVLGLNKYDHDVSAVLLRDGVPVAAICKERLTREKNAGGAPDVAAGYCLKAAGIRLDDVDVVVQNSYALNVPELEQDLLSRVHALHMPPDERALVMGSPLFRRESAVTLSHHLAHAYSAFAPSPFERGAVMVVDGVGSHRRDVVENIPASDTGHAADRESESYYVFRGTEIECVGKEWLRVTPGTLSEDFTKLPGLGATYSRVSEYVFGNWNKCGEVMGLAAFGGPRDDLPPLMGVRDGRTWAVPMWPEWLRNPWVPPHDRDLTHAEEQEAWEASPHQQEWRDLCWRVQTDLEESLLERARWLHEKTGETRLVIAGGVGLNCVANARIIEETPFDEVWVQPAAGDSGISLGCALYGDIAVAGHPRRYAMGTDGLGVAYSDADVDAALATRFIAACVRSRRAADVFAETAEILGRGTVVGWFQGGSELGPRSLGQRSIVCDPRSAEAKRRLNATVKHRQAFRPFAPAVPEELADEWFAPGPESTHMLFVRSIREDRLAQLPAVAHVDGTARLQTVVREHRPEFHALLNAFGELTGVPVLVNTSFNIKGEPIVETPLDALLCFLGTDIDVLVLKDRIVEKRALPAPARRFLVELHKGSAAKDPGFSGT